MEPVAIFAAALLVSSFGMVLLAGAAAALFVWYRRVRSPERTPDERISPAPRPAPPAPAPPPGLRGARTATPIPPPAPALPRRSAAADPPSPHTGMFQRGAAAFDDPELEYGEDEADEVFAPHPPAGGGMARPDARG